VTLQSPGGTGLDGEIAALGPWFHNLRLPGGIETAPDHPLGDFPAFKWAQLAPLLPDDLHGCHALDIGCNAGFYSFELARRGADVVGLDHDEHYLTQARWSRSRLSLDGRVDFRLGDVYDLAHLDETFDLILFMGVLYHLRYPLLALDLVAERLAGTLVVQTLTMPGEPGQDPPADLSLDERELLTSPGWPAMAFVEHRMAGDPTNWWVPNEAALEAMLRSTGLRVTARGGHETWICERREGTAHHDELYRATGRHQTG
jgi:tRNA (mo5U34)-methyltransferase